MIPNPISVTFDRSKGRMVTIETGKNPAAEMCRNGAFSDQVILATVVANKEPKEGQSFPIIRRLPEKFASAGRIPALSLKREARLNDYEILTSRLIDRALRPFS
jgi:polyribonucleotide nucleotidyltransferase